MFICASPKRILNQSQGHMPLTLECDGEEQTVVWPWLDLGSDPPSTPPAPCVTAGKLVNHWQAWFPPWRNEDAPANLTAF